MFAGNYYLVSGKLRRLTFRGRKITGSIADFASLIRRSFTSFNNVTLNKSSPGYSSAEVEN